MLKPPHISITNAFLSYQDKVLFDGLNFQLRAGETTCLLGASGIGKSCFLQLVAGFKMSHGYINIATDDQLGLLGRLAYMPQSGALLPWLTILNNVLLGYRLRRQKRPYLQACELLNKLGLGDTLEKYPAHLSGGMQQRVSLARVLLEDRPIVLMDEPFSALDPMTRHRLQDTAAYALKGRTVLLVTHDPLEALRLGHRIVIMSGYPAGIETVDCPLLNTPPRPLDDLLLQWQAKLLVRLHGID